MVLETSALTPHAQHMADISRAPEPLEAHKESFPGRVSATDPYIDPATATKVRAYAGTTAFIPCIVNNLGQRSVSRISLQGDEQINLQKINGTEYTIGVHVHVCMNFMCSCHAMGVT